MLGKKAQARMPSSFGGLVQYYSEYKSKITIKPEFVLIFGLVFVGAIIALSAVLG